MEDGEAGDVGMESGEAACRGTLPDDVCKHNGSGAFLGCDSGSELGDGGVHLQAWEFLGAVWSDGRHGQSREA